MHMLWTQYWVYITCGHIYISMKCELVHPWFWCGISLSVCRNCNHFSSDFCQRLCGATPPRWINRLAQIASWMPFVLNCLPPQLLSSPSPSHLSPTDVPGACVCVYVCSSIGIYCLPNLKFYWVEGRETIVYVITSLTKTSISLTMECELSREFYPGMCLSIILLSTFKTLALGSFCRQKKWFVMTAILPFLLPSLQRHDQTFLDHWRNVFPVSLCDSLLIDQT